MALKIKGKLPGVDAKDALTPAPAEAMPLPYAVNVPEGQPTQKQLREAKKRGELIGGVPAAGPAKDPAEIDLDALMATPEMNVPGRTRSTKEQIEIRRAQVLRLCLRGVPRAAIAKTLGVNIQTVYDDQHQNNLRMKRQVQSMDYADMIGQSMSFYQEARNMALREAGDSNNKNLTSKMVALRTAIDAENSMHALLTRVGLYRMVPATDPFNDVNTGRRGSYSDEMDIKRFMQLIAPPDTLEGEVIGVAADPDLPES